MSSAVQCALTAEFAKLHNGDEKWDAELRGKPLTTLALQEKLIRLKGEVIVAGVSVVDIAKEGDRYQLDLLVPNLPERPLHGQRLIFELRCTLIDVKFDELQSNPITRELWPDYLVAARIHEVKSAKLVVLSKDVGNELMTPFTAKGECLGLKDIGSIRESYNPQLSEARLR